MNDRHMCLRIYEFREEHSTVRKRTLSTGQEKGHDALQHDILSEECTHIYDVCYQGETLTMDATQPDPTVARPTAETEVEASAEPVEAAEAGAEAEAEAGAEAGTPPRSMGDLVTARDYYGRSALHHLAQGQRAPTVGPAGEAEAEASAAEAEDVAGSLRALLAAGADPAAADRGGRTALHLAAGAGRAEAVAALLAGGAAPGARDRWGREPLALAAGAGAARVAAALLCAGADPAARDRRRRGALHEAAARGHASVARLLLGAGAAPAARDDDGRAPLHLAAEAGHAQIPAFRLADMPANLMSSIISKLAPQSQVKVARVLLAAGACAGLRDWTGCTALHLAAAGGHASAARALLAAGAPPLRRDHRGRAPLHCCPAPAHALRALLATAAADAEARADSR